MAKGMLLMGGRHGARDHATEATGRRGAVSIPMIGWDWHEAAFAPHRDAGVSLW
jgi:hypothetical protein